uniref:Dynein light chain n=1 Tax=Parascaris univalens TaxID=6257 RepID=A0A915B437_PARUN
MHLAQHIMMNFEGKYGTAWHCIATDGDLGFFMHYDTHIHLCVGSAIIGLFKLLDVDKSSHTSMPLVSPDPYVMNKPIPSDLRVIKSGMRHDQQQYAIGLAVSAAERFTNDRMGMARYVVIGFEHVYGAPFHCVASSSHLLGFYVHNDANNYTYFRVAGVTFVLFRQQHQLGEVTSPPPGGAQPMDERTTQSIEYPGDARIISSGMPKDAQDFAISTTQAGLEQKLVTAIKAKLAVCDICSL